MMYLGIIIDTNHFKARLNARTFDAAKRLKEVGADTQLCEELSQEPFENYKIISDNRIAEQTVSVSGLL